MNDKELRIGNHVGMDFTGKVEVATVTGVGYKNNEPIIYYWPQAISDIEEIKGKHYDDIYSLMPYVEPILIIRDLLFNMGFAWRDHAEDYFLEIDDIKFSVAIFKSGCVDCYVEEGTVYTCVAYNIKYIHTLQNIIFSLSRKEVTLTL